MDEDLPFRLLEAVFRSFIEDGSIEVGDRPAEDVLEDCRALAMQLAQNESDLRAILDHRYKLLSRAQSESGTGDPNIAIIFYALWVEHSVNGCVKSALARQGYDTEISDPLIRELRLRTKLTALWRIVGLPPISDEHVRLIEQISEVRNSFVHYKWLSYPSQTHDAMQTRVRNLNGQADALPTIFDAAMNELHWNGREDEIIARYRADYARQVRETGPPPLVQPTPKDAAPDPPSS